MSVIDLQQLMFALCHSEDEVKLAALTLLVESRKSTEPLSAIEMMAILTGFKYCGDTEAPATSHAAISILKKVNFTLQMFAKANYNFFSYSVVFLTVTTRQLLKVVSRVKDTQALLLIFVKMHFQTFSRVQVNVDEAFLCKRSACLEKFLAKKSLGLTFGTSN